MPFDRLSGSFRGNDRGALEDPQMRREWIKKEAVRVRLYLRVAGMGVGAFGGWRRMGRAILRIRVFSMRNAIVEGGLRERAEEEEVETRISSCLNRNL